LFVKKDYNQALDGGDIYNMKLINGLKDLGHEVYEYTIRKNKKGIIPFWKWKITKQDLESINRLQSDFDKTIISHENLADLTKHIKCDLFIFHNLMSKVRGDFFILQLLYKIGSKFHESKAIKNTDHFLVLSFREFSFFKNNNKANYFPPGINKTISTVKEKSIICIPSSSLWILKKMSKLKKSEIYNIENYFKIIDGNNFSRIGVIEDKFDCGFKLRLIQMLFNCDIIITKMDYETEIKALGCSSKNVFQFKDFSNINFDDLLLKVDEKMNDLNREHLSKTYNWESVANNILNILNNETNTIGLTKIGLQSNLLQNLN
tara:strand:- start:39 stop:995 length:957 start_codon:yes stop_codon:yes gene_type:complete